jgi:hypothetical protein
VTETILLILGLVVVPIAALALLTWGLNGTVWLLNRCARRREPVAGTVRWQAPEAAGPGGAEGLPR